jgi:hypothetical protein
VDRRPIALPRPLLDEDAFLALLREHGAAP